MSLSDLRLPPERRGLNQGTCGNAKKDLYYSVRLYMVASYFYWLGRGILPIVNG
jgi:hypothetical protein